MASPAPNAKPLASWNLVTRKVFAALALIFPALVAMQVLFAGFTLLSGKDYGETHVTLGHLMEPFLLLTFILSFLGRTPVMLRWLSGAALVLVVAQSFLISQSMQGDPPVSSYVGGLHALNALAIFWVAIEMGRRSIGFLRPTTLRAGAAPSMA